MKEVIFVIGHTFDFHLFSRILASLDSSKIRPRFILLSYQYVTEKIDLIKNEIHQIDPNYLYVPPSDLPEYELNIYTAIKKAIFFKLKVRQHFGVIKSIVIADKSRFSSNLLISDYATVLLQFYEDSSSTDPDFKYLFFLSFYCSLIALLAGASPLLIRKNIAPTKSNIFDYKILYKKAKVNIVYLGRPVSQHGIILGSLPNISSCGKKIVIFGSRFLHWNLKDIDIQKVLTFYSLIAKKFSHKYEFCYIEHPLEKGIEFAKIANLFAGNIHKVDIAKYISAEDYLMKNKDVILCLSIGSTASKMAFEMGFNSKTVYRLLLTDAVLIRAFNNIFTDLECIHLNDLEDLSLEHKDYSPNVKPDIACLMNLLY